MIEESTTLKKHSFILDERKKGEISGVSDVISFDVSMVLLETTAGMLTIKGKDLHVSNLNLEQGKVSLDGEIDSFTYSEVSGYGQKGQSFFARLFK